jgi:DNA-binding CsgD family transcriptional regulator
MAPGPPVSRFFEAIAVGGLMLSLAIQGKTDEASTLLARFPAEPPEDLAIAAAGMLMAGRAAVLLTTGDPEGALAAATCFITSSRSIGAESPVWDYGTPQSINALRLLGRNSEAHDLARDYLDRCQLTGVPHLVAEGLFLSVIACAPDEMSMAIDSAREACELLDGHRSLWRVGLAQLIYGAVLRRVGQRVEAREHLSAAISVLDECGAVPFAAFARKELVATGARRSASGPGRLSPSEARVVAAALDGLSNPEIAARLFVSRKTVETHLSSAYHKLGIEGRDDLRPDHVTAANTGHDEAPARRLGQ